jgi:hypothetical protein
LRFPFGTSDAQPLENKIEPQNFRELFFCGTLIKTIKYFPPALLAEYPSKWQMPHPPIPEPPPINPLPDLRKGIYILTVLINVPLVFPL